MRIKRPPSRSTAVPYPITAAMRVVEVWLTIICVSMAWTNSLCVVSAFLAPAARSPSKCIFHTKCNTALSSSSASDENSLNNDQLDSFDEWIKMRLGFDVKAAEKATATSRNNNDDCPSAGTSSTGVFWVGSGELYEAYSGNVLARFEGFDVGKALYIKPGHVRQLSRKIFWFQHPETGQLMTEYNGVKVEPIRYDYQVFDYIRSSHTTMTSTNTNTNTNTAEDSTTEGSNIDIGSSLPPILCSVVTGPREVPKVPITAQTAGTNRLTFQVPVFIDIISPAIGKYQAYEFYDYTVDVTYPTKQPPLAVWYRQGSNAPFTEDGRGVMRFVGHRVDCFEDLPDSVKRFIGEKEEELRLFLEPPVDIAEVERLQSLEKKKMKMKKKKNRFVVADN